MQGVRLQQDQHQTEEFHNQASQNSWLLLLLPAYNDLWFSFYFNMI